MPRLKHFFTKKSDLRNIAGRNAYLHVESQFHRFWETSLFIVPLPSPSIHIVGHCTANTYAPSRLSSSKFC